MTCNLDILFLRKEEPGGLILQSGDIDNRIKTLFDALRMPAPGELIPPNMSENPMHCLLESDTLVTGFNVRTDRLLTKPSASDKQVHLVIGIDIRVMHVRGYNLRLLGD